MHQLNAEDTGRLAPAWNTFWQEVPRAVPVTAADLTRRVGDAPGFGETVLLATKDDQGFIHFGPCEGWWFLLGQRPAPDAAAGVIYALCAEDEAVRVSLLTEAERRLRAAGARSAWLWPTWAQGAIPFYNGLTPSNEVSGLWAYHPFRAWAEVRGWQIGGHYRLGVLAPLPTDIQPSLPPGTACVSEAFPAPVLPGAWRLHLSRDGQEIAHVILTPSPERERILGEHECAAFDVSVVPEWRGQGWGKALMAAAIRDARWRGYESMQLHMQAENTAAANLYFRAMGFRHTSGHDFVSLRRSLAEADAEE